MLGSRYCRLAQECVMWVLPCAFQGGHPKVFLQVVGRPECALPWGMLKGEGVFWRHCSVVCITATCSAFTLYLALS